jgi:hypothetical protein
MTSLRKKRIGKHGANAYATIDDLQKLFADGLNGLYQLSFLLTRDREKAEQCFVPGLEDLVKANDGFKVWVHSWAKRTIIHNAICALQPRPGHGNPSAPDTAFSAHNVLRVEDLRFDVDSVLLLEDFERFVFVMSVLEQRWDPDCALLLSCSIQDVRNARARALGQIVSLQIPAARSEERIKSWAAPPPLGVLHALQVAAVDKVQLPQTDFPKSGETIDEIRFHSETKTRGVGISRSGRSRPLTVCQSLGGQVHKAGDTATCG